jgi:hypothetical protein
MNFLRFNVLEIGLNDKLIFYFHVQTETLNDREYCYKILEIGMAQFGARMNFLCILQVSRFVFVLKTNF